MSARDRTGTARTPGLLSIPAALMWLAISWAASAAPKPALAPGSLQPPGKAAPRPIVHAARADGRIKINGRLDEDAWELVDSRDVISRLRLRPNGMLSRMRTECRFLRDDEYLYVSLRGRKFPDRRKRRRLQGEAGVLEQDRIDLCFDVEGNGRSYLLFAVAADGGGADAYVVAVAETTRLLRRCAPRNDRVPLRRHCEPCEAGSGNLAVRERPSATGTT